MTIPNSLSVFRGSNFVLWSGSQGDVIVREGFLAVLPLYEPDFEMELTLNNLKLAFIAIE